MTDPLSRLRRFFRELKRRNVYKVAVTYAAVVFVGLQAVRLLVPATTLPGWADELLIAFAVLGFPIAVVLAWAFEMTAEGVRRTPGAEDATDVGAAYQWMGLAVVVALAGGVWYVTYDVEAGRNIAADDRSATASRQGSPPDSAIARLGDRSIAVLPFEALGQKEPGAFTEGMHDALLTRLSNVSSLKVISRTAV